MERYDLVVIGCRPAGEKGAVQEPSPGGAMIHMGTLASKSLRDSALVISALRQQGFGVETGQGRLPTIGVGCVRAQASFVDATLGKAFKYAANDAPGRLSARREERS